jgi:CheY-like chemotaxis protein
VPNVKRYELVPRPGCGAALWEPRSGTLIDMSVGMASSRITGSVLVVDDDTDLREGLCDILVEEGYSVIGATDGADALAHLNEFALPDVVLLDLRMPRMDGYEFLERRQGDPLLKDVPVIVISSTSEPERLHFSGVATLNKPVNLTTLLGMLKSEIVETRPRNDNGPPARG